MIDLQVCLSLFMVGLLSSTHCVGMCGGIMGALTMAIPADAKAQQRVIVVAYNVGRIASYTLMGVLVGFFAREIAAVGGMLVLRVLAAMLLIAMGLYLADWWRGLTQLETFGRYLWVYLQPFSKRLMPVDTIAKALQLGALWGWLPCGLVYSALASAMTQLSPLAAGSAMLAFGLGTLPMVVATGLAAQQLTRLLQRRGLRMLMGLLIILFGCWTLWGALTHSHHHHDGTMDHSTMNAAEMKDSEMKDSKMQGAEMDHSNMQPAESRSGEQGSASSSDPHMHHHH